MNPARFVAAQDHRLGAHARREVIAGFRDLALVPDKQPGAREEFFEFLGEDAVIDKDFAADDAALGIDETCVAVHGIASIGARCVLAKLRCGGPDRNPLLAIVRLAASVQDRA